MSEITKEQVQLMLDNHSKSIELSNVKAELEKVQQENKDLITKLSSEEETVEEIQEKVQDAVETSLEANEGEVSELSEVLAKVAGLEEAMTSFDEKLEEISSKFKDVCSSIKTVTPLEAGIGKMSTAEEESVIEEVNADEVVIENHDDEEEKAEEVKEKAEEEVITDEEVESAITVLEAYFDAVGSLDELPEASSLRGKARKSITKLASKFNKEDASSLRRTIRDRKPVRELSSKKSVLEDLKDRTGKKFVYSSRKTRFEGSEYHAGELAGRLFGKNQNK